MPKILISLKNALKKISLKKHHDEQINQLQDHSNSKHKSHEKQIQHLNTTLEAHDFWKNQDPFNTPTNKLLEHFLDHQQVELIDSLTKDFTYNI
jgi:hypothetical protein